MRTADIDGFVVLSRPTEFSCPDPAIIDQLAITANICDGVPEGETRSGYVVSALQSEVSAFDEAMYRDWLARKLTQVGGDVTFASVGCPAVQGAPDCRGTVAVVLITNTGPQLLIQFTFALEADGYSITHSTSGVVSLNEVMVKGGIVNRRLTDDSADDTIYFPVVGQ